MSRVTDLRSAVRRMACAAFSLLMVGLCHAAEPTAGVGTTPTAGMSAGVRSASLDLRSLPDIERTKPSSTARAAKVGSAGDGNDSRPKNAGAQDPLVNEQQRAALKAGAGLTFDIGVDGVGFTGVTPAEPVGEVGGEYFVQMVNAPGGSVFAVYDTSDGDLVAGPSKLAGLWQGAGACAEGWGHPGVVYDAVGDRWVLTELGTGNHLCVYVSQTADPVAGGWFAYDFALPKFPDFARLGVWNDGYYVATNEDLPAVYALERSAMLVGNAAAWQRFTVPALEGFGFQSLAPVDLDGPNLPSAGSGAMFMRHADGQAHGGADRLELYELDVSWSSPASSSLSGPTIVATAAFDSGLCGLAARECVPQPGTSVALDPVREVVMWAPRYRNFASHESIVGNFTVDGGESDRAAIRWFELRRAGGSWALHQEGTYNPDDRHHWIGSTAMDRDGNLGLAFNVSDGSSTYPSIGVTGRESSGAAGVMTMTEVEIRSGTSAQTVGHSPEQWGASTSVSVNPDDDCTFWATAAFAEDGAWNTRIASFRFPSCASSDPDPDHIFSCGLETGNVQLWSSVVH